jgi:hypothetical protein
MSFSSTFSRQKKIVKSAVRRKENGNENTGRLIVVVISSDLKYVRLGRRKSGDISIEDVGGRIREYRDYAVKGSESRFVRCSQRSSVRKKKRRGREGISVVKVYI